MQYFSTCLEFITSLSILHCVLIHIQPVITCPQYLKEKCRAPCMVATFSFFSFLKDDLGFIIHKAYKIVTYKRFSKHDIFYYIEPRGLDFKGSWTLFILGNETILEKSKYKMDPRFFKTRILRFQILDMRHLILGVFYRWFEDMRYKDLILGWILNAGRRLAIMSASLLSSLGTCLMLKSWNLDAKPFIFYSIGLTSHFYNIFSIKMVSN